ncbi:MAG: L-2-hydroxyglutarate oxidase [Candidatus Marinimicrobia bacterium]|nr:L-2-hydroxyglutarate oxidase [Candidatus Neomarinimicrobiota bacterium]MCF7880258.1 L-2-hydroxyglutarate oxidase [Candidatus Neomarinimicrobiota bacterium]
MPKTYDIAIIGGGIVGAATANQLTSQTSASVVILEAEDHLAAHQTGNNSGVVHSGLYYKPGSLKATTCTSGRKALYEFCEDYDIPHDRCGKVVVATSEEEIPRLDELERRGRANGLQGIRRLSPEEIREYEPHVAGVDGLHVPETGIVDFSKVTETYAKLSQDRGAEIRLNSEVTGFAKDGDEFVLETKSGEVRCKNLINCGGLQCDRIARMCGVEPDIRIVPFRGEYYELVPESHSLVNDLIYPVPDPEFPFLGVHFTRMVHGGVEAGPNAVLAFKREGYNKLSFSLKDTLSTFGYDGFWKLAGQYWQTGIGEFYRSFSKSAFVKALQKLIPEIQESDLRAGDAGVRAQALDKEGNLIDDFHILQERGMIHVLNAPSPAATASLSIGQRIADLAEEHFGLNEGNMV